MWKVGISYPQLLWTSYVVRRYMWIMWISYPQKMWISFGTQLAL
jgi:hypothetical protein